MPKVSCRFTTCNWSGHEHYLYQHACENHSAYIRNETEENQFELNVEDLQRDIVLLRASSGLYWFRQNQTDNDDCFQKGLFTVGNSEVLDYTLKIKKRLSGGADLLGPYTAKPDSSEEFDLHFSFEYIIKINNSYKNKFFIYLGSYEKDDADDLTDFEDEIVDHYDLDVFTCPVCLEYIKTNARFCANRHFLCNDCFNEIMKRPDKICPTCRGVFLEDTQSEDVENLLKVLQFSD